MKLKYIPIVLLLIAGVSCKKDWLERTPKSILTDAQVWNDPTQLLALIANYYDRIPTHMGLNNVTENSGTLVLSNWRNMADYDDAMWSGNSNDEGRNNIPTYPADKWNYWDYALIRDINLSLEKMEELGTRLTPEVKQQFNAEFRFIRAWIYFELVRRMGGVPLVTTQLIYDYSGDVTPYQVPRAKEEAVYDFIASEMDDIKDKLDNAGAGEAGGASRANRYAALALKSRAMLYAASLAKYNNIGQHVSTPGGEVGISAGRADEYYQKSLAASQEIINSGVYSLKASAESPAQAFYEGVTKKAGNNEAIFVKDFLSSKNKRHGFTYENIARSIREDNLSSAQVVPTLNLVEAFDYLDGSPGTLKTRTADNSDYIYYDKPEDIFSNKDARLLGTILYPGSTFKGYTIEMQAGVKEWSGSSYQTIEGGQLGVQYTDGGLLVAAAGPHRSIQDVSNTGFYMHKYIDDAPGSSTRGILSDIWWVWIRLGEVYLNAAEAAFELGETDDALTYINTLRERAGFGPNSLSSLTIDKIRNERRVELAFEDHRFWDLKRWRIADQVWNGNVNNPNSVLYALYPYRVIRPGDPRHGKYVFDKLQAPRFVAPRFFQARNYYNFIPQNVLDNNPLIVRNPLQ